ncbi:hypothetical protein TNCV_2614041 [Trichonephila clavipes]|nr:hypothetical protein TNCV_2614041 [Trichonephila clavipes]
MFVTANNLDGTEDDYVFMDQGNSNGEKSLEDVEEKSQDFLKKTFLKFNFLCYLTVITSDIDTAPEETQLEHNDLQSDHNVMEIFHAMTLNYFVTDLYTFLPLILLGDLFAFNSRYSQPTLRKKRIVICKLTARRDRVPKVVISSDSRAALQAASYLEAPKSVEILKLQLLIDDLLQSHIGVAM